MSFSWASCAAFWKCLEVDTTRGGVEKRDLEALMKLSFVKPLLASSQTPIKPMAIDASAPDWPSLACYVVLNGSHD